MMPVFWYTIAVRKMRKKTAEVVPDGASRKHEVWKCERKLTD